MTVSFHLWRQRLMRDNLIILEQSYVFFPDRKAQPSGHMEVLPYYFNSWECVAKSECPRSQGLHYHLRKVLMLFLSVF